MRKNYLKSHLFLILMTVAPFFIFFLKSSYIPIGDQFHMLQAAHRFLKGYGLTASLDDNRNWDIQKDLSQNNYQHLSNWPPGYPVSIYFLFKLGFSHNTAPKIFHLFFLILGLMCWLILLQYLYGELSHGLKMIFLIIIIIALSFLSDSNLVFWALFPVIIYLLLNLEKRNYYPFIISLILSLLIVFRYQSLFLIIGIFLFIFFTRKYTPKQFTIKSISLFMLPLITYISINVLNRTLGQDLFTQQMDYQYGFNLIWILNSIKAFTLELFFLDRILKTILINFFNFYNTEVAIYIISIIILIIYSGIIYKSKKKNHLKEFVTLFLILFITNYLFLFILSILQSNSEASLAAIFVNRYYRFFFPFFLIIILVTFKEKIEKIKTPILFISAALFFGIWILLNYFYFSEKIRTFEKYSYFREKVRTLSEKEKCDKVFVISYDSFLNYYDDIVHYRFLINPSELYFSKKTLLVLINTRLQKQYFYNKKVDSIEFRGFSYNKFIQSNKLEKYDDIIYYKVFEPYQKLNY